MFNMGIATLERMNWLLAQLAFARLSYDGRRRIELLRSLYAEIASEINRGDKELAKKVHDSWKRIQDEVYRMENNGPKKGLAITPPLDKELFNFELLLRGQISPITLPKKDGPENAFLR